MPSASPRAFYLLVGSRCPLSCASHALAYHFRIAFPKEQTTIRGRKMENFIVWAIRQAIGFVKDTWLQKSWERREMADVEESARIYYRVAFLAQVRGARYAHGVGAHHELFKKIQKHGIAIADISRDVLDGGGARFEELYARYLEELKGLRETFWCNELSFPRTVAAQYLKYEGVCRRYELAYRRIAGAANLKDRFVQLAALEYEENTLALPLREAIRCAIE